MRIWEASSIHTIHCMKWHFYQMRIIIPVAGMITPSMCWRHHHKQASRIVCLPYDQCLNREISYGGLLSIFILDHCGDRRAVHPVSDHGNRLHGRRVWTSCKQKISCGCNWEDVDCRLLAFEVYVVPLVGYILAGEISQRTSTSGVTHGTEGCTDQSTATVTGICNPGAMRVCSHRGKYHTASETAFLSFPAPRSAQVAHDRKSRSYQTMLP